MWASGKPVERCCRPPESYAFASIFACGVAANSGGIWTSNSLNAARSFWMLTKFVGRSPRAARILDFFHPYRDLGEVARQAPRALQRSTCSTSVSSSDGADSTQSSGVFDTKPPSQ